MSRVSYLERRGSRYYFRGRLPLDLAGLAGRSHVVFALGTADQRAAKILATRFFLLLANFLARIRLRMQQDANTSEMRGSPAEKLATAVLVLGTEYQLQAQRLQQDFDQRLQELIAGFRRQVSEVGLDVDLEDRAALFGCVPEVLPRPVALAAPLTNGLAQAADATQLEFAAGRAATSSSPRWRILIDAFFSDKPDLSQKTLWSYNQAFDGWERLIGNKPIAEIRRPDVKRYADHLRDRPSGRGGVLNHKSIERSLGHIKTFMAWAVAAGHVADDQFGVVKGRDRTHEERMAGEARRAFSQAELDQLFSSPLFREELRDEADRAAAWFLTIAALTGARTEEIASAPAELIKLGEVWCLDLRQVGTKTRAAPRLVPLLPDLIRLGLPSWTARQSALGRRLVQPGPEARTPSAWSKYLNRYINNHIADAPDLVLYSLRHSYRQMLRAANIGDELANKVFGHEHGTVGAGYGRELSPQEAALVVASVKPPVNLHNLLGLG